MLRLRVRRLAPASFVFLSIIGTASAQDVITVSGDITTRPDGGPVPGAAVAIVGGGGRATADANGHYTLSAPRSAVRAGRPVPNGRAYRKVDL